jgi:predicted amino acid-binding ACT domain protein
MTHRALRQRPRVRVDRRVRVAGVCGTPPPIAVSPVPAPQAVLTVTGLYRPGIVEQVFAALARPGTGPSLHLVDVGQVVMNGQLVLVVGVRPADDPSRDVVDAVLAGLVRLAAELSAATGAQVRVDATSAPFSPGADPALQIALLGRPVPLSALAAATQAVAATGGAIEAISGLSDDPLTGVGFIVSGAEPAGLCAELASVAAATGVDILVE